MEMQMKRGFEKWVRFSATDQEDEVEEEEEEALSLCDLPVKEDNHESRQEAPIEAEDDFDFCNMSKQERQMCAADEVFFEGQILPLQLSRSTSMERSYSSSGFTSGSSRSSSTRSHRSSRSSSSSNSSTNKPKASNHFQYHSHPSPTPQIKASNLRTKSIGNSNNKSTVWSLFRLGLLTPPEIALEDLKLRSNNIKDKAFGSRNSSTSSSSSSCRIRKASKKKKQGIMFERNGGFFGGCKCSVDAVETLPFQIPSFLRNEEEVNKITDVKGTKQRQKEEAEEVGKKAMSRHRTFEWLKQLSLDSQTPHDL